MLAGPRGSGVTTQLELLEKEYGIPELIVQAEFLKLLRAGKARRKHERLLKRGFKAPPPKDDEEEEEAEEVVEEDPEIDEEP